MQSKKLERKKTPLKWSSSFAIFLLSLLSCQTVPDTENFQGRVYMGASDLGGLYRNMDSPIIKCDDSKFDDFVCMPTKDYEGLVNMFLKRCRK